MSDFKAEMHPLGLRPRSGCGSLQRSPDSIAALMGQLLREGERGGERKVEWKER